MLNVLLLDDNPNFREYLRGLLEKLDSSVNIVGTASNVNEALKIASNEKIDLAFLDVELQGESGFEFVEKLPSIDFDVVFATAHSQYAIKAIKYAALDYLLKPINQDELEELLKRKKMQELSKESYNYLKSQIDILKENLSVGIKDQKIGISIRKNELVFIKTSDIIYCNADGVYTKFFLAGGKDFLVSKNLKEYESLLTEPMFCRVHKSYIINVNQIEKYVKTSGSHLIMSNGTTVPVSKSKKDHLIDLISHF